MRQLQPQKQHQQERQQHGQQQQQERQPEVKEMFASFAKNNKITLIRPCRGTYIIKRITRANVSNTFI